MNAQIVYLSPYSSLFVSIDIYFGLFKKHLKENWKEKI